MFGGGGAVLYCNYFPSNFGNFPLRLNSVAKRSISDKACNYYDVISFDDAISFQVVKQNCNFSLANV